MAVDGLVELKGSHGCWPVWVLQLMPGMRVSKAILEGGEQFALATGKDPEFAFIQDIPKGAEEFAELRTMTLIKADWVRPGEVVIARGGMTAIQEGFRKWQRV